ncbi:hypothetical protein CDEF62S_06100 [Castellaniella defragrans]
MFLVLHACRLFEMGRTPLVGAMSNGWTFFSDLQEHETATRKSARHSGHIRGLQSRQKASQQPSPPKPPRQNPRPPRNPPPRQPPRSRPSRRHPWLKRQRPNLQQSQSQQNQRRRSQLLKPAAKAAAKPRQGWRCQEGRSEGRGKDFGKSFGGKVCKRQSFNGEIGNQISCETCGQESRRQGTCQEGCCKTRGSQEARRKESAMGVLMKRRLRPENLR